MGNYYLIMKFFGLTVWPVSHALGILSLNEKTHAKPTYKVKMFYTSWFEYVQAIMIVIPICVLTWLSNRAYPIQQELEEAYMAAHKAKQGNYDLINYLWIFKMMARDLIVSLSIPIVWQHVLFNSSY